MNYLEKYGNEKGACASCRHIRDFVDSKDIKTERVLLNYSGGKHAACVNRHGSTIVMSDVPNEALPVNECWTPSMSFKASN